MYIIYLNIISQVYNVYSLIILQDNLEVHYAGFKTPDIHKLSDLVQENVAAQVCKLFVINWGLINSVKNI